MKQGIITFLQVKSDYNPPTGDPLKVCDVVLDTGASGVTYIKTKDFHLYKEQLIVNYEERSAGKLKLSLIPAGVNAPVQQTQTAKNYPKQNQSHTITYYLGYATGYAKDIVIAEAQISKAKEIDVERFLKISTQIYDHMEHLFEGHHKIDADFLEEPEA